MSHVSVTRRSAVVLSWFFISWVVHADGLGIQYHSNTQSLWVEHCFDQAPDFVTALEDQTIKNTQNLSWQTKSLKFSGDTVDLPDGESGCLRYQNLANSEQSNRRSNRFKIQHPESKLVSIKSLIWQPNDHKKRALPEVIIKHDENIKVSAPWQLINRTSTQTTFLKKPTPNYSDGFIALGPLDIRKVQLGESNLRLAIMSGNSQYSGDVIERWITQMAASVAQVGMSFPLKDIQVLVVLMTGSSGAVPWGQVNRAGGQGVLLVVNPTQSQQKLFSDWTAAHEFSHLLMPYTPNDRWLSEGFASYHQNISRLRTGLLDEATAWGKLLSGFERGLKSASAKSAPKLNRAGRKNNMQMYWGGAVIALKADVALQHQSNGQMSLSKALNGLQNCCLDTGRSWSAKQLFKELDRISETEVFITLYEQEVQQKAYPNYQNILKSLGIRKSSYGQVEFDDKAPKAHIRKKISKG